jgi:hypothetical protein
MVIPQIYSHNIHIIIFILNQLPSKEGPLVLPYVNGLGVDVFGRGIIVCACTDNTHTSYHHALSKGKVLVVSLLRGLAWLAQHGFQ